MNINAVDIKNKEIEKFGRKTHLPGNVIFKFLDSFSGSFVSFSNSKLYIILGISCS